MATHATWVTQVTSQWSSAELKSAPTTAPPWHARWCVFDTSGLVGKQIIQGTLQLWNWHSWSCAAREVRVHRLDGAFTAGTVWDNQPPYFGVVEGSTNLSFGYEAGGCGDAWVYMDIALALVQAWADQTVANHGFLIRAANEGDVYAWKKIQHGRRGSPTGDTPSPHRRSSSELLGWK